MGIYATPEDVEEYIEGFTIDNEEALERYIFRAETMIDEHLPPTGVDLINGRKFDPTDTEGLTVDQVTALNRATCAQVEYILYLGPEAFVEDRIHEGDSKQTAVVKPRRLAPKAQYELYANGFIARTGRMT